MPRFDEKAPQDDLAEQVVLERLSQIQSSGKAPLVSVDLDDTFLPFGAVITNKEIDLLTDYVSVGGQIAFNTLASKEWFYLRVIEPLTGAVHRTGRLPLLSRIHWIVSGGREIFVYDSSTRNYRRVYAAMEGSKANGLLHLTRHMGQAVGLLGLYGDRFDDPDNDGNAIEAEEIPVVINVGADQLVSRREPRQIFVNVARKGPETTLRHLALLTRELHSSSPPPIALVGQAVVDKNSAEKGSRWRFDLAQALWPGARFTEVEVEGPGFVWSWNPEGLCHLAPLLRNGEHPESVNHVAYTSPLPEGISGFTFFWTGGEDARSGKEPGHWEGRDFAAQSPSAAL